ncbi:MAG: DUF4340 domain-containing protein [bacterium]|nr:DUF4340 domain-containing protein [bacterium]
MNLRGTLGLLLVAVGLGAYVWFVEIRGEQERQAAEKAEKRLLEISADTVQSLELVTSDGGPARAVRDGDGWRLETPVAYPANPASIDGALAALAEFDFAARIERPDESLEAFGLGEKAQPVVLKLSDGNSIRISLGGKTPVGGMRYVALERESEFIYTVPEQVTGPLTPTLFSLRDKRILDFDSDAVTAMRVSANGSLVAAAERVLEGETPGSWHLSAPIEDRASMSQITRLLVDLSLASATGFVDEPESESSYGLDRPDIEVDIVEPERTRHLELAKSGDETYMRVAGRPLVFRIPQSLLQNIPVDLFSFRDHQVLELAEKEIRQVQIEFPREQKSFRFERVKNDWLPLDSEVRLKPLKIDDLVYSIESLEATEVVDGAPKLAVLGLDPPRVRVRLGDDAGEEFGWLELGDPAPNVGLPARSSRRPKIWRVNSDLGREVPLGFEAFENLFVEPSEDVEEDEAEATPVAPDTGS